MRDWEEARDRSKIKRLSWKKILGMNMSKFVMMHRRVGRSQEDIVVEILRRCRLPSNKELTAGWYWQNIVKNVRIGVSARMAELNIYKD